MSWKNKGGTVIRKVYFFMLALAGLLIVYPVGEAAVSQGVSSFKDLKTVDIIIEDIEPGLGFSKKDIQNYVTSKLRKRLPALKIKRNAHDYLYVRIVALDVKKDFMAGNISITVKRRLILTDKETLITAGVRNYGNIFFVSKEKSFGYVKNILNNLLNTFVTEYRKSRDYYSGKKKGAASDMKRRDSKGKTKENENKVWGN
jgi:hypothetical protein